jgi:hypothetical protein
MNCLSLKRQCLPEVLGYGECFSSPCRHHPIMLKVVCSCARIVDALGSESAPYRLLLNLLLGRMSCACIVAACGHLASAARTVFGSMFKCVCLITCTLLAPRGKQKTVAFPTRSARGTGHSLVSLRFLIISEVSLTGEP